MRVVLKGVCVRVVLKGVCVSRHLNDDLICDSMTMCQSRSQDDDSMMIVSIEAHGTCCLGQPSATSPLFFDNLHFEHFDKSVNHKFTLKCLSKCSKWRLSKKRGLVADGWSGSDAVGLRATRVNGVCVSRHLNYDLIFVDDDVSVEVTR